MSTPTHVKITRTLTITEHIPLDEIGADLFIDGSDGSTATERVLVSQTGNTFWEKLEGFNDLSSEAHYPEGAEEEGQPAAAVPPSGLIGQYTETAEFVTL